MIDADLAAQLVRLLATAIGEMMEDGSPDALHAPGSGPDSQMVAERLRQVGTDTATLAAAMAVLARLGAAKE